MQWSRIIITYLILWEKLALNGARMVKIALGGENFVFRVVGKMRNRGFMLLLNDLSHVA